jgi:hypothetical protein
VASGLHKDLLLELPSHLQKVGIRGLIVPIEDFVEAPSGLRKQVEQICQELGLEHAFWPFMRSILSRRMHFGWQVQLVLNIRVHIRRLGILLVRILDLRTGLFLVRIG